jgi:hypothetical protein
VILHEHEMFGDAALLKVDTDGHDGDILLAAERFLRSVQPVVFFEFDPRMARDVGGTDPVAALEMLARIGYDRALVFANTGPLVASLSGDGWLSGASPLAKGLEPDSALAYYDIAVFAPRDRALADRVEMAERSRSEAKRSISDDAGATRRSRIQQASRSRCDPK